MSSPPDTAWVGFFLQFLGAVIAIKVVAALLGIGPLIDQIIKAVVVLAIAVGVFRAGVWLRGG